MKVTLELSVQEIRQAVAEYCERTQRTHGEICSPNQVVLQISDDDWEDVEDAQIRAIVEWEKP